MSVARLLAERGEHAALVDIADALSADPPPSGAQHLIPAAPTVDSSEARLPVQPSI
jgi:hypothetical protein